MASPLNPVPSSSTVSSSLPTKRPLSSTTASNTRTPVQNKRRKHSTTSSIKHPLRQTSFPTESFSTSLISSPHPHTGHGHTRSPSVSSSITAASKRSAKSKRASKKLKSTAPPPPPSTTSNPPGPRTAPRSISGLTNPASRDETPAGDAEQDMEDDDITSTHDDISASAKADAEQRQKKEALLIGALTKTQSERYDAYRRAKLSPAIVRRITNSTLSQSVPDIVVKTISGFTKVFVGEVVERARLVRDEWLEAEQAARLEGADRQTHLQEAREAERQSAGIYSSLQFNDPTQILGDGSWTEDDGPPLNGGPLLPDHLREAIRRYRNERESSGAGLRGLSLTAMRGMGGTTAVRKPLFK